MVFASKDQRSRYRKRTGSGKYPTRRYSKKEDELVLDHSIPDRELSKQLKRSVTSIQIRRNRLKENLKLDLDK